MASPNPVEPVASQAEERYPIRIVSALTGVNAVTLRAWERRFGLVNPMRTQTGHRLYSRDDIERLNHAVALLDEGRSINEVAELVQRDSHRPRASASLDSDPCWSEYRQRMLSAVTRFNENALDGVYQEVLSLYPAHVVINRLIVPLLDELGQRWQTAEGSIAEEHFFGVYMRNKLGARFHHRSELNKGPRLLGACLPGETHEIGLLLFALVAHDHGYRQVLLGANMPLEEVAIAAHRSSSDAIVLSGHIEPAPGVIEDGLPMLRRATRRPIFVGGHLSVRRRAAIARAGALPIGDDVEKGLRRITLALSGTPTEVVRADQSAG